MRPELCIRRLTATYRLDSRDADVAARLDRVLTRVARVELVRSMLESAVGPGEWCIRRLDVTVPVRLTDTDASIARQWSSSLVAAVRQLTSCGSPELVHYSQRRDALVELVSDTVSGRPDRAWAWEHVGVRSPSDPSPWHAPLDAILVALCRAPHETLPVIAATCRRIGLPSLDRVLGADGWIAVIEIVTGVANADASTRRIVALTHDASATDHADRVGGHARRSAASAASQRIARAVTSTSTIFEHVRRSRLRPDAIRSWAWALLASIEVEPSIARRRDGDEVISLVASAIASVGANSAGLVGGTDVASGDRAGRDVAAGRVDRSVPFDPALEESPRRSIDTARLVGDASSPADLRPGESGADVEAVDSGTDGVRRRDGGPTTSGATAWAGLMFLLNVAADGDLIAELIDADELVDRTTRWTLHALARELLPLGRNDPAALAFAGLDPAAPAPSTGTSPATPAELSCLQRLGDRWAVALAERLGRAELDARAVVEHVAARHGEIEAEPGWIDVHLRLDEVDLDVRMAGLDFDPGWIPWLGSVVRFVHDS